MNEEDQNHRVARTDMGRGPSSYASRARRARDSGLREPRGVRLLARQAPRVVAYPLGDSSAR